MAVTYGFYNSRNKDRAYNAEDVSRIFDGVISDGVYQGIPNKNDCLFVRAGTGMQIIVGPGRAWFNHTWTFNDIDLPIGVSGADIAGSRIDTVVLKIDRRDSARMNSIYIQKGAPASSNPQPYDFPEEDDVYYHKLAYITIASGTTEITDGMIQNLVGTNITPFVAGVVRQVSVDTLLRQWSAQWNEFYKKETQEFNEDIADQRGEWWEYMNTTKAEWDSYFRAASEETEELINAFHSWTGSTEVEFIEWFQNLEDQLDDNQAAHLQNEIDDLKEQIIPKNNHIAKVKTQFGLMNKIDTFGNHENAEITFSSDRDEWRMVKHVLSDTLEYQFVMIYDKITNTISENYIYISGDQEEFNEFVNTQTVVTKDDANLISRMDTTGEDYERLLTYQTTRNITKWTDKVNDNGTIDVVYDKTSEIILVSKEAS